MMTSMLRVARISALRPGMGLRWASTESGSVFSELSAGAERTPAETPENIDVKPEDVTVENDAALQKFLNPRPYITVQSLLSPLKQQLYALNVKKNGFFKNGERLQLNGSAYEMKLTREEIEALEPSILLRSYRIKSSVKKTNIVLRALKGLPLKKALTQTQFMQKKVSRDLTEMLQRGLDDAQRMNYNVDKLYLDQLWVHTDGAWQRRIEWKGRGRMGILTHRYVCVRILVKSDQTLKRLAYEAQSRAQNRKVEPKTVQGVIRGQLPGYYRW